jgi:hypothetical protein
VGIGALTEGAQFRSGLAAVAGTAVVKDVKALVGCPVDASFLFIITGQNKW